MLGSILGALKGIVNVIGMTRMTPPIKDLLPRLTPILKNRHEKVGLSRARMGGVLGSCALCLQCSEGGQMHGACSFMPYSFVLLV